VRTLTWIASDGTRTNLSDGSAGIIARHAPIGLEAPVPVNTIDEALFDGAVLVQRRKTSRSIAIGFFLEHKTRVETPIAVLARLLQGPGTLEWRDDVNVRTLTQVIYEAGIDGSGDVNLWQRSLVASLIALDPWWYGTQQSQLLVISAPTLFDAALEDPLIHDFEHALFLASALLFWWPAVALDPAPWRMPHPARAMYVFLQMTQNTFLAVVLLNLGAVLYPHYATVARPWGPTPLQDQATAAGIMWLAGDAIFLVAILGILVGWMRADARDTVRTDRRAAVELADIRVRERMLAERLAHEREEGQSGSGASR
jgi:hypothetical protein